MRDMQYCKSLSVPPREQKGANVTVRAENVQVSKNHMNSRITVTFDFRCPNCKEQHERREICRTPFSEVYYRLGCGDVEVSLLPKDREP